MKISLTLFISLFVLVSNAVMSDEAKDAEILIVCTMEKRNMDKKYFVINKSESIAKFMNPTNAVKGKLTTTENSYVLHFPKTPKRYETIVKINRYSGQVEWEHGEPPFGEFNLKNIAMAGVCSQGKNIKRF